MKSRTGTAQPTWSVLRINMSKLSGLQKSKKVWIALFPTLVELKQSFASVS